MQSSNIKHVGARRLTVLSLSYSQYLLVLPSPARTACSRVSTLLLRPSRHPASCKKCKNILVKFVFSSDLTFPADCGTVQWLELSRLTDSLVTPITPIFNGVTDKKSSSILIYQNKAMDIYTDIGGIIKTKCK